VIYDADKIKNPGGLLIFADAFQRNSTDSASEGAYWNFVPNAESDKKSCVTLIHSNQTAGSFADGHAEGMDPGRLKDCATGVNAFNNDNFDKDNNSTN
jgi:prepilin-type processing-associated H-X9-DG protein